MGEFQHAVVLEPIPRDWFDSTVGLGHDVLAEYLGGEELPLAGGRHLTSGAWYSSADESVMVTIDSWNRDRETAVKIHVVDPDAAAICHVRLSSAAEPCTAELTAKVRFSAPRGFGWLAKGKVRMGADLERWWSGGEPAIDGWAKHAAVRASFTLTRTPEGDGAWRVTVHGKLRSRGVLAPLTAITLLFARRAAQRAFTDGVEKFAEEWNREVPALLMTSPDELRVRFAEELEKTRSL